MSLLRKRRERVDTLKFLEQVTGEIHQRIAPFEGLLQRLHEDVRQQGTDIADVVDRLRSLEHLGAREESLKGLEAVISAHQTTLDGLLDRVTSFEAGQSDLRAAVDGLATAIADDTKSQAHVRKRVKQLLVRVDDQRTATAAIVDAASRIEHALSALGKSMPSQTDVKLRLKQIRREIRDEFRELRKLKNPLGEASDPAFRAIAEPVLRSGRTLLGYDRLFVLWQAARNVAELKLPAAEIGAFRGGSAFFLAKALETTAQTAELHVVDTFTGHPDQKISLHDPERHRGKFADTSYEAVCDYLAEFAGVHVYQGEASDVLRTWPERTYGLVHIDVDLYVPTAECLQYFGGRLASGGIIVMDDYGAPSCPGVMLALREFLDGFPSFQQWDTHTEQLVLVKR